MSDTVFQKPKNVYRKRPGRLLRSISEDGGRGVKRKLDVLDPDDSQSNDISAEYSNGPSTLNSNHNDEVTF